MAHFVNENFMTYNLDDMIRVYVPSFGGFNDCVHADTRVLTADHRWVPASILKPGEQLIGFDEGSLSRGQKGVRRRMRRSIVQGIMVHRKSGILVRMESGIEAKASYDQKFLRKQGQNGGSILWRMARDLRVGDTLQTFPMSTEEASYEAGWFAGFVDGEGFVCNRHEAGIRRGWSQLAGGTLDYSMEVAERLCGKRPYISSAGKGRALNVALGGWNALLLLQKTQPKRLIKKDVWEGKCLPVPTTGDRIAAMDWIGLIDMVCIQTSTNTFIAEGMCLHSFVGGSA